jgi:antigen flippase
MSWPLANDAPKAVAPPPASGLQAPPTPVPVLAPEGGQPEAGIFSILSRYAVMQVVLAFTALVRNKVVALRLGPSAFGEISQIGAVVALVATLVSFGMGISLSRNVAKSQKLQDRQSHLANANGIVLTLSFVAVPVTLGLLVAGNFLRLAGLTESPLTVLTAALFIAGVPFIGLQRNYIALLQDILDIRGLAVQRSVAVLLATVVSVPIVWFFGFVGAAVQFLAVNLFVTLLLGWRCRSLGYAPLAVRLDGARSCSWPPSA